MKSSIESPVTRMLRRREVETRTGLSRSTIYELMAKGSFPKPVLLGSKIVCWIEQEIEAWLQAKIEHNRRAVK